MLLSLRGESSAIGSYDPDPEHNGGRPLQSVHLTREQLEKLCSEGAAMIEASVKAADIKKIVQAVKDQAKYVHEVILPRYKDIVPKDKLK